MAKEQETQEWDGTTEWIMKHEERENLTVTKLLKTASLTAIVTTMQGIGMAGETTQKDVGRYLKEEAK